MDDSPIEQTVIEWLKTDEHLSDYVIATQMPENSPDHVIIVEQSNVTMGLVTADWTISVDVYAPTQYECALTTSDTVIPRLRDLYKTARVADCSINASAHYPHPGSPVRERYTITLQITTGI
ncbi:hypothetical protein [Alloscardovia omnicolens]